MLGSIRAIDEASTHRITSGQVIVDLQTAVKELVENALDAGATSIDVRCKESGSSSFEVIDNGTGIAPHDYATVALRSHTSKLTTYDDLLGVSSFGFRGEALASLCQMADVTITTATADQEPLGTVLTFGRQGKLLDSSKKVARQRGTSTFVTNLFAAVPVRRKEFEKNVKKHFGNVQTLLQAYCLININCKITVSNQIGAKPYQTLFKTDGNSLRENFATLFTAKTALTLLDINVPLYPAGVAASPTNDSSPSIRLKGLISRPEASAGRTSGDRQFFYINSRPFDGKTIAKAVNETFKQYVGSHFPIAILDIVLPTAAYDVNVSPDKRTIFLHSERNLLEAIKTAIDGIYQPFRSTYTLNPTHMTQALARDRKPTQADKNDTLVTAESGRNVSSEPCSSSPEATSQALSLSSNAIDAEIIVVDHASRSSHSSASLDALDVPSPPAQGGIAEQNNIGDLISSIDIKFQAHPTAAAIPLRWKSLRTDSIDGISEVEESRRAKKDKLYHGESSKQQGIVDYAHPLPPTRLTETGSDNGDNGGTVHLLRRPMEPWQEQTKGSFTSELAPGLASKLDFSRDGTEIEIQAASASETHAPDINEAEMIQLKHELGSMNDVTGDRADHKSAYCTLDAGVEQTLSIDISSIRLNNKRTHYRQSCSIAGSQREIKDKLEAAGVSQDDAHARQALTRLIHKTDFADMSIVGQFNLSFIIARRWNSTDQQDDLMIIDQHASDEKWNFERLQQVTKIDSQKLLQPRVMNLPASDELIAIENAGILRFNGFDIDIDEDASTGQRIRLLALPVSKSTKKTEFTIADFEELLFLLRDHTGNCMVRPTKTRKLFAMLACRSSVMVGKVLSKAQMTSIVRHMGLMDQPWNCPHGRNTMRWLAGLSLPEPDQRFTVCRQSFAKLLCESSMDL